MASNIGSRTWTVAGYVCLLTLLSFSASEAHGSHGARGSAMLPFNDQPSYKHYQQDTVATSKALNNEAPEDQDPWREEGVEQQEEEMSPVHKYDVNVGKLEPSGLSEDYEDEEYYEGYQPVIDTSKNIPPADANSGLGTGASSFEDQVYEASGDEDEENKETRNKIKSPLGLLNSPYNTTGQPTTSFPIETTTFEGPKLVVHPIPSDVEVVNVKDSNSPHYKHIQPISRGGASSYTSRGLIQGRAPSDEEKLLQHLFSDYNPAARPVINSSKTVPVAITFSLMHIKDLDVRSQIFTTTGLLILDWTDERLKWQPREHNNLEEVIIEARAMWRPEFAVINGAEKIYEDYNQFRAVITHEGKVHWEPGGVFKTMCEIDITYYPFDEQRCELVFGAWSYHTSKMNLTNSSDIVNLDSYKGNGEWEVYHTEVIRNEFYYDCCPDQRFANVAFAILLRRRHTFYILNVILPSIMTSVLLLSVFFCTPGQKVQIGVVVLLSFRIFLLNVADNIPKTSDHIPLLGIYLTCTMAITTLSMVLTVFVLNLHHITDKPVPVWLKRFCFIYVARMLGMCSTANEALREAKRNQRKTSFFRRSSIVVDADGEERAAIIELQNRGSSAPNNNTNGGHEPVPPVPGMHNPNVHTNSHAGHILSSRSSKREEEPAPKEDYAKDWKRLAEIFDRLFFWLFLLAIFISTLVLFHPLTKSYMENKGVV